MKYREKRHEIEAVQWNGNNRGEICGLTGKTEKELFYYGQLQIEFCGELVVVAPGDYVARLENGQIALYSKKHIEAYYEPVAEGAEKITISTPPRAGKHSRVESMFGPRESWGSGAKREDQEARPEEDITMEDAVKGLEKPKRTRGYTGFLHLRCEVCGKTKSACIKKPLKEHRCTCGHETKLEKLKRVEFTCSCCGSEFIYQTNENCLGFTMECLSCKAPVDLVYSQRGKKYKGGEQLG